GGSGGAAGTPAEEAARRVVPRPAGSARRDRGRRIDRFGRSMTGPVRELRVAVTVDDYAQALAFYRDALGLPVVKSWETDDGSGAGSDAGRATHDLPPTEQPEHVDTREP